MDSFTEKRTAEKEVFSFDVTNLLADGELIIAVAFACTIKSSDLPIDQAAIDAAAAMIVGLSAINGPIVSQAVQNGVSGNYYYLTANITTPRQVFQVVGIIPVLNGV